MNVSVDRFNRYHTSAIAIDMMYNLYKNTVFNVLEEPELQTVR